MEKALEIIKLNKQMALLLNSTEEEIAEFDEAIAELEAMKQRTCEGCRSENKKDRWCDMCIREYLHLKDMFVAKDNA